MSNLLHTLLQASNYFAEQTLCTHFEKGSRTVKNRKEEYLPKLSDGAAYDNYIKRAVVPDWVNATKTGLAGLVLKRAPKWTFSSENLTYLTTSATNYGESLQTLSRNVLNHLINPGRVGLLIEAPAEGGNPYITIYPWNTIIEVVSRVDIPTGRIKLVKVVVSETVDPATLSTTTRELRINEQGVYEQVVYDKAQNQVGTPIIPKTSNGSPLYEIPFVLGNATNMDILPDRPPLYGIADLAHHTYMNSADYELALHYQAFPLMVVTGWTPNEGETSKSIGPGEVWVFPDKETQVTRIEPPQLTALEKAIENKEKAAKALGATLVAEESRSGSETAEGARIKQSGKTSLLHNIAANASEIMTRALGFVDVFVNNITTPQDSACKFTYNTEFFTEKMDATLLTVLLDNWFKSVLPTKDLVHNLTRYEVLDPTASKEEQIAQMDAIKEQAKQEAMAQAKAELEAQLKIKQSNTATTPPSA